MVQSEAIFFVIVTVRFVTIAVFPVTDCGFVVVKSEYSRGDRVIVLSFGKIDSQDGTSPIGEVESTLVREAFVSMLACLIGRKAESKFLNSGTEKFMLKEVALSDSSLSRSSQPLTVSSSQSWSVATAADSVSVSVTLPSSTGESHACSDC